MKDKKSRKDELVRVIENANIRVVDHLSRYEASHEKIGRDERFQQELGEIRAFLISARASLDDLLTLREHPHILAPGKNLTDPTSIGEENRLVSDVVYNGKMALALRANLDAGGSSEIDGLKSIRHHIQAEFTLAELYLALGVNIEEAQQKYRQITKEGPQVFKRMKDHSNPGLVVPMIRLAYKIGTSHKRLFDIEYHIFDSIPKTIEVVRGPDDSSVESLNYGQTLDEKGRRKGPHPDYMKAREWLWQLFDLNQMAKLTDLQNLEFSHYEFMLYRKDVADLRIGCVFNALNGDKMGCISTICTKDSGCLNYSIETKYSLNQGEKDSIKARAQLKQEKF